MVKEVVLISDALYLSQSFLQKNGVTDKCIKHWFDRKRVTKYRVDNVNYVLYTSIPLPTRITLPSKEDLLAAISIEQYNGKLEGMARGMEYAKRNNFHKHYNLINSKYTLPTEDCRDFAQKWAVWEWIITNYPHHARDIDLLHKAYTKVIPGHTGSYNTFCNWRKDCFNAQKTANSLETVIIDNRSITKTQPRHGEFMMCLLRGLYVEGRAKSGREAFRIAHKVCAENGQECQKVGTIRNIWSEFGKNADMLTLRYGQKEGKKKMQYASLNDAAHINSQWQADGKTGAHFVRGADGSGERWVVFLVQDNHSRKYVGYAVGKSENTELILEAYEDAVKKTGYWPHELIMDKHSFTRTQNAALLFSEAERMGSTITETTNPQGKAIVERQNQNLDAIWKDYPHYLGGGLTSKNINARPKQEAINEAYKPKNYLVPEQFRAIVMASIHKFNDTPQAVLDGLTPNQKYAQSESKHAFVINEEMRQKLFRAAKVYKVIRGQINIKVGMKLHEYQLPAALYQLYNDRYVEVRHEDLKDGIYLFDTKTGDCIDFVKPKERINGAKADQTPKDIELLNKLAGRKKGTLKKAQKAQDVMKQTMLNNPEHAAIIDYTLAPKDVVAEVQTNADLTRLAKIEGLDVNKIPIKGTKPVAVTTTTGKTKASPFAPKDVEFRPFTIDEIFPAYEY
jgi:hypothetical protein